MSLLRDWILNLSNGIIITYKSTNSQLEANLILKWCPTDNVLTAPHQAFAAQLNVIHVRSHFFRQNLPLDNDAFRTCKYFFSK